MADSTETTMRQEDQVEKKTFLSKRAHRAVDTLERTFEALNLKHFDSEFSVDPLFKKMCAEFDESGSKGFLTCSLSLGANGRLLLDSNDAAPVDEIVTEIAADEAVVDIGGLVSGLVGLESRSVLPSLTNYSFGNHDMSKMDRQLSETLTKLATMTVSKDKMELDSDDDDAIHEEIPDFGDYDEPVPIDDGMYADYNEASIPMQETLGTQQVFEELEQTTVEAGLTHSFLTYFDSKLNHNWAGPEHWKIHRPHLHRASVESKPRVAKKEFLLDFEGDPVDVSTLFAKANPVAITLSKSTIDERNEKDNLLPEDLHFSSGQLLRLFIKPTWTIGKRMVTKTVTVNDTIRPDLVPEQELGAEYWADLANLEPLHHEPLSEIAPANNDDYEYDDEAPPLPLSAISNPLPTGVTQAIGDDLVPISRAITTNTIHYDRHAKKIDVQELKRILWVEIEALGKKPKSTTSFNSLMKDAQDGSMSAEMRKDVSVPYYFICLLHLANEHNLELKSASDDLLVSCSPQ
jgi:condensin complex subunit 2